MKQAQEDQKHPQSLANKGKYTFRWDPRLPPLAHYPQDQFSVPVTGEVECVAATAVTARNIVKDLLANRFGFPPLLDLSVEQYVANLDSVGLKKWLCRIPSNLPKIGGWMHPRIQLPHALNQLSDDLRQHYGCGFTYRQTSGNSLTDGKLVLVHGLWETKNRHDARYYLKGSPHTMGIVVEIDLENDVVRVMNTNGKLDAITIKEFSEFWGRRSFANAYTKPNTMTVVIPDTVCSPPSTTPSP
jgi:hypothetical protein